MKADSLNYREVLKDYMPVTFDSINIEDGHEVERMWLANFVGDKWVEDYVMVYRYAYDTMKEEDGAIFAKVQNGRMLVKAPDVEHYRIPEDVYRIAKNAFRDCTKLKHLDVPHLIEEEELKQAFENCNNKPQVKIWYWSYNNERSEELKKEIEEGYTDEYGFVYSKDRKRLLKAANVGKYYIPEGVESIDRLAFVHCIFEELNVPYTCDLQKVSADEVPIFGSELIQGDVIFWDKPYRCKK